MSKLPRLAQLYVWSVYLLGLATLAVAPHLYTKASVNTWEIWLFIILSCLASSRHIRLTPKKNDDDAGSMSLGFIATFAALLHFGPNTGMMIGSVSCLLSCLYPKRQPLHQLCFNTTISIAESWIAGLVFVTINKGLALVGPLQTFEAVTCSVLVYFLINTFSVATIVALCSGQRIWKVWQQTFMWTAPSYFAGASIATLATMLFRDNISAVLLFISPVAYLTYYSYAVYTSRAEEKQQHIEDLSDSKAQLADLYLATIKSLALAIDAKDQYTHQHILRVQRYSVAIAKHMGLTGNELEGVNTGALLHDIGKLGVPEYVLLKPGRLTEEEFAKIKKHPEIGAAILDPVEFPWPVLPGVKYHHEKWDGTGYPEGLAGENIPRTARILSVADVYDALTSTRSYRNAWTHEKACEVIKKDAGTHFDPVVVEAFLAIIDSVVAEMAKEGEGPLVERSTTEQAPKSKSAQAARDIQRASSELWALYEVAQTLSSSLGLQETLEILARKLEAILPGTGCLFLLHDKEQQQMVVRVAVGLNREFFENCRTLSSEGCSAQAAVRREKYVGPYDADDLLINGSPGFEWVPLKSALIVPIVHQDQVLGTINLYHSQTDAFGPHDQQLLETIADRSAMALYNGILYDRTRSHAFTDPLTGLYNVRYFTEQVEDRCERNQRTIQNSTLPETVSSETVSSELQMVTGASAEEAPPRQADRFAMLCLDLDSFKPINDNFGHQKGDQVLRDLGRIFRSHVREDDIVARYGGDEFLIMLNNAESFEAEQMVKRLQSAVERYDPGLVHPRLGSLRLGVSIGYACYPDEGQDCTALLSAADNKMYSDKTERKLGIMADRNHSRDAECIDISFPQAA